MVMIYRDPSGEAIGSKPSAVPTFDFIASHGSVSEEEKEMLLKLIQEKDDKIEQLTVENNALKVHKSEQSHYYHIKVG